MPLLAEKLRTGARLDGVILKMPSPALVEQSGLLGFDLVVIDTEHGPGDTSLLEQHVRAGDAVGVPIIVRVPVNHFAPIQSALDSGASGVIIPHIASAAAAAGAVGAAHYPPYGHRGLALSTRAARHGTIALSEHLRRVHEQTVVIAQIEEPAGVAAAAEIAAVQGLDGVWIGPNDLAVSIGAAVESEAVQSAINVVARAVSASPAVLIALCADAQDRSRWAAAGASTFLYTGQGLFAAGAQGVLPLSG